MSYDSKDVPTPSLSALPASRRKVVVHDTEERIASLDTPQFRNAVRRYRVQEIQQLAGGTGTRNLELMRAVDP